MIPSFPQVRSLTVARVIKHLNTVDRVTKVLQGEHDVPEAVIKFRSPKQMTMIRDLIMTITGAGDAGISIFLNSNPGYVQGNVIKDNDYMSYKDFVIAPDCTLECHAKYDHWRPELEFPDMFFRAEVIFEGPLEVIDG